MYQQEARQDKTRQETRGFVTTLTYLGISAFKVAYTYCTTGKIILRSTGVNGGCIKRDISKIDESGSLWNTRLS